jgi:hypothetical protein
MKNPKIRFFVKPVGSVNVDVIVEADAPFNGPLSDFGIRNRAGSGGQLLVPPYTRDLTFRIPKDKVKAFKAKAIRFIANY